MKQFFRQTFNLLAENKLHSSIVIVGTAVRLTIDGAEMRDMEVGEWPRS